MCSTTNCCKRCYNNFNISEKTYIGEELNTDYNSDESSSREETKISDYESGSQTSEEEEELYVPDNLDREDFDNFLTCNFEPDIQNTDDNDDFLETNAIPFSDAGEIYYDVEEDNENKGVFADVTINGYTLLNQCGSLLTRQKHDLRPSANQSYFLQKLCSTSVGKFIPLV